MEEEGTSSRSAPTPGARPIPAGRLQRLAAAFAAMRSTSSVAETLERVTQETRTMLHATQAVTCFTWPAQGGRGRGTSTLAAVALPGLTTTRLHTGEGADDEDLPIILRFAGTQPHRLDHRALLDHPAWSSRGRAPPHGLVVAPLLGHDGRHLGVAQACDPEGGEFTREDELTLAHLAQMASVALENAVLHEQEHADAQALQRRLLPPGLPNLDDLDVAAYYRPGRHGTVGGDWYDVVDLGHGRVTLMIGDVMGRGVEAAAVMGQLRVALRAYALEGIEPSAGLTALNRLVDTLDGEYLVTVLSAEWELSTGTLWFANAGHLAPLLRLPDGTATYLRGTQGPPIGVDPSARYVDLRVDTPRGATLALFTNGLVVDRDHGIDFTLGAMARAALQAGSEADAVMDRLLATAPAEADDDVAVLVARRRGATSAPALETRWTYSTALPCDPAAVQVARRWVHNALARSGLSADPATVELLTSEVVTNAIVHATSEVTLGLVIHPGRVRVVVRDRDLQVPSVAAFDLESVGGRGMGLVDALAADWGVDLDAEGKNVWFEVAAAA
jgi:serine phosphatase RsbU (regulator of sigma subunit)/anti-sigma regulatory factor (Ser/Thr protein kinase)